jgi:2-methylisocitrate lyase-like PEP mutase family enzyme
MSSLEIFKKLHHGSDLFILPNAWDARSAMAFEQSGFKAVATSSAAVANSFGAEDGEKMTFSEYLAVVAIITRSVRIPVTVDLETGYGKDVAQILNNVIQLANLGVCGINIEDSSIKQGERSLKDPQEFALLISSLKQRLSESKKEVFINIRTDAYILNVPNKENETLTRIDLYNHSGADGIFVPCLTREEDIAEVVKRSRLPLNVMAIGGLPSFQRLNTLGVRRVSMGPFMFHKVYSQIAVLSKTMLSEDSVAAITS